MYFSFQFRRDELLKHYHLRSNIASTFSMVKAKFRDHVRSRTDVAMKNEVLCKFLCHNICVVHQSHIELGIEPVFWAERPTDPADRRGDGQPTVGRAGVKKPAGAQEAVGCPRET